MDCLNCKSEYELTHEPLTVKLENGIIVIDDVPTKVCEKCGESVYSNDVAKQIEKIINEAKNTFKEIKLVQYSETNVA
jgi:YgiT-type zinc finger domain-containing protein